MNHLATKACLGFFGGERLNCRELYRAGSYHDVRALTGTEFADRIDELLRLYDPAVTYVQLNLLDSHDTPRFLTSVGGDR